MLLPRFTIRTLLGLTTLCAVLFLVLGLAFRGQSWAWAWGLSIGVASIAVTALVHAAWFGLVSLFARLFAREESPRRDNVLLLAIAVGAWYFAAAEVQAQPPAQIPVQPNGVRVTMPTDRVTSRSSGLSLSIDTRWVDNFGYRPIAVAVSSPSPTTADHLITIRLLAGSWVRWGTITVEQDFELPMGSTSAETTIACPQYQSDIPGWYFTWEVWVDGVKDEDLSMDRRAAMSLMSSGGGSPVQYAMLVIGTTSQERQILNPASTEAGVMALPMADLPTRWIDYTCLDIVSFTGDELRQVAQSSPDAFHAICRWVRAGGQLWVTGLGDQWEGLPGVDETLGLLPAELGPSAEGNATEAGDALPAGWEPLQFGNGRQRRNSQFFRQLSTGEVHAARDPELVDLLRSNPDWVAVDPPKRQPGAGNRNTNRPTDSALWFVQKPMGLGQVRAFRMKWDATGLVLAPAGPAPQGAQPPPAGSLTPLSAAVQTSRDWGSRHGLLPNEANRDFSNLLVPGVGLAPVMEFCVLITFFVLVIGPVNYWLLKRFQRVHLIVITVPAGAAVMTLALFAYALVSDGLGTTVRVHSLTMLDQRTGEAVCWARLSYYAGLAPGQGLILPSDTVVYPITPGWDEAAADGSAVTKDRELQWDGQTARLTVGWLASRTPTQYLTIRSRQSPFRLELAEASDAPRATNQLGTSVSYVVAVDRSGNLFTGEQIAAGSSTRLQPVERGDAMARWRRLVSDNAPQPPPGLADSAADLLRMQQRSRRRSMQRLYGRLDYSQQQLTNNLLSGTIRELTGEEGQSGLQLPPRSYLAVTSFGPEVELGISEATEEASFHVLVGRW
jgi:hypothetical protein